VLRFKDSPTAYPGMYRDGQVQVFYTELVGVDANGNIVQHYGGLIPGADFRWSTDQTAGFWNGEHWTGGIFLAGDPDWPGRPPRVSGGIYLGAPPITEIPEPGTLALTGLGLLAFAVIRRARRARARR